jgi:type II secretory ATPase GspE/PulE/Tfp pilus assembly ATPase PilB-like protein
LTGHLVLSTLHANTAPDAIKRLADIGVEPFIVNNAVAGVISQRLVRILCSECKEEAEPELHSLPPEARELIGRTEGPTFHTPRGCDACQGTGYRGRTAIHEILIPDDAVREVVGRSGSVQEIRGAALGAGMRSLLACGLQKAARGVTSLQEVARVVLGAQLG